MEFVRLPYFDGLIRAGTGDGAFIVANGEAFYPIGVAYIGFHAIASIEFP